VLSCRRDDFTDTVRENMLSAYEFLDAVIADDIDLFSSEGLEALFASESSRAAGQGIQPAGIRPAYQCYANAIFR
jgi:hypothetical protein